jgi:hypothetical protein
VNQPYSLAGGGNNPHLWKGSDYLVVVHVAAHRYDSLLLQSVQDRQTHNVARMEDHFCVSKKIFKDKVQHGVR